MTVKEMKQKLSELPEDAVIVAVNDNLYVDGLYTATELRYDKIFNTVSVATDYKDFAPGWVDEEETEQ